MADSLTPAQLLDKYPIISDQVNRAQLEVILTELQKVLDAGLPGAIVEFGCYVGTTSLFITRLLEQLTSGTHTSSSCAFSQRGTDRAVYEYGEGSTADKKCAGAEEASGAASTAGGQDRRCVCRKFHVYDSFEGLPEKSTEDASRAGEQFQAGELSVSKKQFIHEFQKANLPLPIIHKGWFADLQSSDVPDTIAFAFLDGDFYGSIASSLRLVLPRMEKGGVIIIDDFAREALPGAAKAVRQLIPPAQFDRIRTPHNMGVLTF